MALPMMSKCRGDICGARMVCVWRIGLVNTGRKAEAAGRGVGGVSRRSSTAASRERIRMRAAPRDAPSSILMSVCSFPALVRSSDT